MDFSNKTILELFDSSKKTYEIPVYQRAYSWEKNQWRTFLNDILEQIEGGNNYFYGNLLLETLTKGKKYEIIDGQQRITTLTIFIRSIINVLESRKEEIDQEFDLESRERIFLKDGGNIKLRPVDYDRACYDTVIIDNKNYYEVLTQSQKRMIEAKAYFISELEKLSTSKIYKVLEKVEETDITVIELAGKKDSALMFELENNRGKDLTNMEKIKSYFMYQMYVYSSSEETEVNIEYVSNIFKIIYQLINDFKRLNEDSVLIYHNNAYIKGYSYRTLDDIKEKFKQSEDKIKWIKNYIAELQISFTNMKKFENSELSYAKKLERLNAPAFIYPFIIKGYKYFGADDNKLNTLFRLLEILTFRTKLINSRANIQERLNLILLNFKGDLFNLITDVKNKLNDSWYWGDVNVRNYLNGGMYGNRVVYYLLWEYENYIQKKGYSVGNMTLEDEQIEHISPQTPTNGEILESGYDLDENGGYSEDFVSDCLNCLGNLMLISGKHNRSIGNKPFKEKYATYKEIPLLNQQSEIKEFVDFENETPVWKTSSIIKRKQQIVDFSIKKWSFENIDVRHVVPTLEECLEN